MNLIEIECSLNGKPTTLTAPPMARLLDVIREGAQLTGTKEGCGEGECGACSILMDGKLVNSCLVPFVQVAGSEITTIEGVQGKDESLHAVQRCFLETGGAQCGICTPGMILASIHLLEKAPQASEAEIREGLAGNICRCTGYMKIFDAVRKGRTPLERPSL